MFDADLPDDLWWADRIRRWAETPVTLLDLRREYPLMPARSRTAFPPETLVRRTAYRVRDVLIAFDMDPNDPSDQQRFAIYANVNADWVRAKTAVYRFGVQGRWRLWTGASREGRTMGFEPIPLDDLDPEAADLI